MHYIKKLFPQSIKNIFHLFQAILANVIFGFPSKKIKVIGVTGTDGKTTTVQMITKILEEAGKKVAMASTINFVINGVEEKNLTHFTTESAFAVQKFIKKAVESGSEYLVLETSSHSLDQYRVWGVDFKTAVITNITREHLDYHGTMEKYREAKRKLFVKVIGHQSSVIIVNAEMDKPEEFLHYDAIKKFVYSVKNTRLPLIDDKLQYVFAENVELGINFSKYKIQNTEYILNIPGSFNIENALAATCVGLSEEIKPETIKEALGKIKGVAGRMEAIENDLGLHIFVDFALTPNALERLYSNLFQTKEANAKIIALFGSCGDRDRGKRPIMGDVVSRYADKIILTNDEPYHEDPRQIINEIAVGVKNKIENESLWIIEDRREAIKKALGIAKAGDIVVLTGMGNFESMVVGDKKIPWNDRQVVLEELQKILK
jgi:UDP-N-acetylmuramoyl-L-alanyl-D-glutamate--2,6-diaminopimelate ligase